VTWVAERHLVHASIGRSAVAVIRAWTEGKRGERLVVRISTVDDLRNSERRIAAAANIDEATGIVRRWLQAFVDDHAATRPTTDETTGPPVIEP
jgi:hypothetical protein